MTKKFFVYGTLKVGGRFAKSFDRIRTSSKVAKLNGFDLYGIGPGKSAGFPGIVKGTGTVIGELHEYDEAYAEEVIEAMDHIEGYNRHNEELSLYIRRTATVTLENGDEEEAYVYIYNNTPEKGYPLIKDGVWKI